jgi:hypothetical protein
VNSPALFLLCRVPAYFLVVYTGFLITLQGFESRCQINERSVPVDRNFVGGIGAVGIKVHFVSDGCRVTGTFILPGRIGVCSPRKQAGYGGFYAIRYGRTVMRMHGRFVAETGQE